MNKCCRTCALWNRKAAMDAAGRIRKVRAVLCNWKSTEPYPDSVTGRYGNSRPTAGFTVSTDGINCPCWIESLELRRIQIGDKAVVTGMKPASLDGTYTCIDVIEK